MLNRGDLAVDPEAGTREPALETALREALEIIDLLERAEDGEQSAMYDIRIRPSVMKSWLRRVRALLGAQPPAKP